MWKSTATKTNEQNTESHASTVSAIKTQFGPIKSLCPDTWQRRREARVTHRTACRDLGTSWLCHRHSWDNHLSLIASLVFFFLKAISKVNLLMQIAMKIRWDEQNPSWEHGSPWTTVNRPQETTIPIGLCHLSWTNSTGAAWRTWFMMAFIHQASNILKDGYHAEFLLKWFQWISHTFLT